MMKKNIKKIMALGLSVSMIAGLTACGGGSGDSAQTPAANTDSEAQAPAGDAAGDDTAKTDEKADAAAPSSQGHRVIKVGCWYPHYYDSTHTGIDDNPAYDDPDEAQMQFDNLKAVEEKYDVEIEFVNLTFNGVKESINTSILAGQPDCDIYEVDLQFGIPAALNGFATNLEEVLPADADVVSEHISVLKL